MTSNPEHSPGDNSDMATPQQPIPSQHPQGITPQYGYAPQQYPPPYQQQYQQPYPTQQYPPSPYQGYAPMQQMQQMPSLKQGRDRATYVRQQKGHSIIKHICLGWVTMYIYTIYIAVSPNHYFHA